MRIAEEMVQFCDDNNTGKGMTAKWRLKHFKVVEQQLKDDEDVLVCFIGLKNFVDIAHHEDNWAYAITNKRIIMGQKGLIGEKVVVVSLRDLNDVSFKKGVVFGVLTIDTIKEVFNVGLDKNSATSIHELVTNALMDLKEEMHRSSQPVQQAKADDPYEEIKKLKELLDMGIITEEEFNLKKKNILGIWQKNRGRDKHIPYYNEYNN